MRYTALGYLISVGCSWCAAAIFVACSGSDGARGAQGVAALVSASTEPASGNCDAGGVKIVAGIDSNGDGKLSDEEITSTQYVCNGVNGDAGTPGETGRDGNDGAKGDPGDRGDAGPAGPKGDKGDRGDAGPKGDQGDKGDRGDAGPKGDPGATGDAGANGSSALVGVDQEPMGAHCPNGGVRVTAGIDLDGNGTLDDSEVTSTEYVCNGAPGSATGSGGSGGSAEAGGGSGGGVASGGTAGAVGDGGA